MNDFEVKPVHEPVLDEVTRAQIDNHSFYKSNKIFIWASLLGLIIVGILAYLVFFAKGTDSGQPANVELTVNVPKQVPSGSEVVYGVQIENKDSKTLASGQLELVLPEGASYQSSNPTSLNTNGTLYSVPSLAPGQNTVLFIKLKLAGGVGDTKKLIATYRYKLSGVSSEFQKEIAAELQLSASDVSIEWDGPVSTNNSQLIVYTIRYRNGSKNEIASSRVQVEYPAGFNMSSSDPQPDISNNTWSVGRLAPGQEGKIVVNGNFEGAQSGETKTLKADFLVLGTTGSFFTQSSSTYATKIASTPLSVSLRLENPSNKVTRPGDQISVVVEYANNSDRPARAVNIAATINSKATDLSSINSEGAIVNGNTITWNASSSSRLETLAPNARGELRFEFTTKNPPVRDNSRNIDISILSQIRSTEFSTPFNGNTAVVKIASVASIIPDVAYSNGPRPPRVGAETRYNVTLTLKNTTNDMADGIVTAFLPLDPSSFDKNSVTSKEINNVTFDQATGKITWKVGGIPAGTGSFLQSRTVSFTVKVTPQASMVDRPVTILKNISISAKDTFTNLNLDLKADDLTTLDDGDGRDGIVVK